MKIPTLFLVSCLCVNCLVVTNSFAQHRDAFRNNTLIAFDPLLVGTNTQGDVSSWSNSERIMAAQGSMYLDPDWKMGNLLLTNDTLVEGLKFRYNIYTRQMHFLFERDTLAITNPELVKYITFGNRVFTYLNYLDDISIKKDYFQILADGKCKLLLMRKVRFEPKSPPPTPYSSGTIQDRFVSFEYFYLQKNDELPILYTKTRKSLLRMMNDHRDAVSVFIRNEKCKLRKQEDLVKIIQYYNSLQ